MNYVQTWYLVIAGLLGLGIPFMFFGLQLPTAMSAAILSEAAEYVILDEEDCDFWASVPGRTGMQIKKRFYIFNCTNADNVTALGVDPEYVEIGPFEYIYEHELEHRGYNEKEKVSFYKNFKHTYKGDQKELKKEYRVINLSGMKRWESAKNKQRFQMAIEGFFETFMYSRNHLLRDMSIRKVITRFKNTKEIYDLARGLPNVTNKVIEALAHDYHYGLVLAQNVYEWSMMCDLEYPYIEHELMTYFGFSLPNFLEVKKRFCKIYNESREQNRNEACKHISNCTDYSISFSQWMHGSVIKGSYKNISFKTLYGIFEFSEYRKEFLSTINQIYRDQFSSIKWEDKSYYYLLDTYYEYPDFITDESSVFLYENMRMLYSAGKGTHNPFVAGAGPLDLSRFDSISKNLKLSKEQAFMLYCYFEYYVNNTMILEKLGGDIKKERVANYGAFVLKDISSYYTDFLDMIIYSRALHNNNKGRDCISLVKDYFTINETEGIIDSISIALCNNKKFNTDISTAVGWKYFIDATSYPFHFSYKRLYTYLNSTIHNISPDIIRAMLFNTTSRFWNTLNEIKTKVKIHYNEKTGNKACEESYSPYCSKRQLFFSQFYDSLITNHPYPDSELPKSLYISDWWTYISPYIEYIDNLTSPSINLPLPDQPITVPTEMKFLKDHFGSTNIDKTDLYNCFNLIYLYDTDVIYDIFLKIDHTDKPKVCEKFSSKFFYNATKYLIRNVQFGPMFARLKPEQVYFGYLDSLLKTEHELTDYLQGDDCTVNPWIGYNPISSNLKEETFDYLNEIHTMRTGLERNNDVRKYVRYYGNSTIYYKTLVRDTNGDKCPFVTDNPFTTEPYILDLTDGLQFSQDQTNTRRGTVKTFLDDTFRRPIQLTRATDDTYNLMNIKVDPYLLDLNTKFVSKNGIYLNNAIEMSSFYQYISMFSKIDYTNFDEQRIYKPKIKYNYSIKEDYVPPGLKEYDSYYSIEPYTGITMEYNKKLMFSLILYYDELYESISDLNIGEVLPSYSLYEKGSVSNEFLTNLAGRIFGSKYTREQIATTLTVFGVIFLLAGISMIVRSCWFTQAEITGVEEEKSIIKKEVEDENELKMLPSELEGIEDTETLLP